MGGLLTALIFVPLVGGFFVLLQSEERSIWNSAFIFSLVPLALSLYIFAAFEPARAGYQFEEQAQWIPQFGISYHLGIDGISLVLVVLTTILITLSLLYSGGGDIDHRPREFCFFMLALETGLLGTLLAVDLFLFYVFWELMLFPMYFLIGIWGHGRPIYAAVKFVLYTMIGSFLMLAAIIYLVLTYRASSGAVSFDLPMLYNTPMTATEARWMFAAFALAFAIKVPMWPVHTWLPDAHTNAPTAGSVMLAGVMLKMGTYGFLRFAIPLFPAVAIEATPLFLALAVIGIIYGALVAMVQPDLKRLVAYSSVSHLGFVVLGLFAFNTQGMDGAVYQMLNHGVSTGALFLLVGMIYLRRHTREISEFGGLWHSVPIWAAVFMFAMLSSIGLPGLNGFIGEFLIMMGGYVQSWTAIVFAVTGVILGALYMLWTYERVMYGPITKKVNETIRDMTAREIATMVPLMALMVVMGLYPQFIFARMEPSIAQVLSRVHAAQAKMAHLTPNPSPFRRGEPEKSITRTAFELRSPFPEGEGGQGVRSLQGVRQ
ncbi:MAG TPA: NADH-quinone oxidoreductase subunit M [Candidatus Binataceae bacterium]|nr:NADH-quinone oxidoreductase subunit M [Candidatus Binataceae bacterium]